MQKNICRQIYYCSVKYVKNFIMTVMCFGTYTLR